MKTIILESGKCSNPYDDLQLAHDLAPDGSMVFISEGTYYEAGTVLDRPMEIHATGEAVIR